MLLPASTGSGASAPETLNDGTESTVVVMPGPATGAVSAQSMEAEPLVMTVPLASGLVTRTTICTEPLAPAFSVPRLHDTVPEACDPPPVADTKVVLAGT